MSKLFVTAAITAALIVSPAFAGEKTDRLAVYEQDPSTWMESYSASTHVDPLNFAFTPDYAVRADYMKDDKMHEALWGKGNCLIRKCKE